MATDRAEHEGDLGLGAPVYGALAVVLLLAVLWLLFGFPAMFWPALILTPVLFAVIVRFCVGRF